MVYCKYLSDSRDSETVEFGAAYSMMACLKASLELEVIQREQG